MKHSFLNATKVAWDDQNPPSFGPRGQLLCGDYATTQILMPVHVGVPVDLHFDKGRLQKMVCHVDGETVEVGQEFINSLFYAGIPSQIKTEVPMIFHGVLQPGSTSFAIAQPLRVAEAFVRGNPRKLFAEIGFSLRLHFHYLYEASPTPPRTQFKYFNTEIKQVRRYGFKFQHVETRTASSEHIEGLRLASKHADQHPDRVKRFKNLVQRMEYDIRLLISDMRAQTTMYDIAFAGILIANGNKTLFLNHGLRPGADTRYACFLTF